MKTRRRSAMAIPLLFFMGAVIDFVIGYLHGRSIQYGIGRAVVGLFGTAFLAWVFGIFDKVECSEDPKAENEPTKPVL